MRLANTMNINDTALLTLKLPKTVAQRTKRIGHTITLWLIRYRTRKQLRQLSERQRADVGISLEQAKREVKKPFWR